MKKEKERERHSFIRREVSETLMQWLLTFFIAEL